MQRVLKEQGYHAFKPATPQHLDDEDFDRRLQFAQWAIEQIDADATFLRRLVMTDEAHIKLHLTPNKQNVREYAITNPHFTVETHFQHNPGTNVWCGFVGTTLLGPFFIDGTLNGERYLQLLNDQIQSAIEEEVALAYRQSVWYQHDGAPPHFFLQARDWLNLQYGGRWIGRGGPVEWPPRSPDLTPPDFFLWGYIKDQLSAAQQHPENIQQLRESIVEVCHSITPDMIAQVWQNFDERLRHCVAAEGRHFENVVLN